MTSLKRKGDHSSERISVRLEKGTVLLSGLSQKQLKILSAASLDDPAIVFCWDPDAIATAVAFTNAPPPAAAPLRPGFLGQNVYTMLTFQQSIIDHVAALQSGVQSRMESVVIAPLTLQQYSEAIAKIADLRTEPFFVAMFNVMGQRPLATIAFIADGKRSTTAARVNFGRPPAHGRVVFV